MLESASLLALACGMQATAAGAAVWNGIRHVPGLRRAVRVVAWVAAAPLATAVLLSWITGLGPAAISLHLAIAAAIAAPSLRVQRPPRRDAIAALTGLVLTVGALLLAAGDVPAGLPGLTLTGVTAAICAGLAARVLGETLGALVSPDIPVGRLSDALYLLLTLLTGVNALTTLALQGVAWNGSALEGKLVGMWLVWSAAQAIPRHHRRLRAGTTALAALLFVVLALGTH